MAVRRCDPCSMPFVYHAFSARSLLITQRSRPRAGLGGGRPFARRRVAEAARPRSRARPAAGRCSRAGTARARRASTARGRPPAGEVVRPARGSTGCAARRARRARRSRRCPRAASTTCSGSTQSPLPSTGIDTPSATRAIRSQSDTPEYDCAAVRPCTATAGGARVLHHPRERRRVDLAVVPARRASSRSRGSSRPSPSPHDHRRRVLRLAHQAAARVVLGDLRHRAAHVDVDDVGAHAPRRSAPPPPSARDRRRRSGSRPGAPPRCTRRTRACDRCRAPAPRS